jgi:hypothetical protein
VKSRLPALLLSLSISGCAWFASDKSELRVQPEWRLIPEAIALGQRRQFFLYGRHLDSAVVTVPPSVILERGALNNGGRVLALYLTVKGLEKDSLAEGESVGKREVDVKTPDTSLTFTLKIVDEAVVR